MHIASRRGQHITSPTVATVNRVYIRWHLVFSIVTLTSSLLLGLVYRPLIGRALGPQAPTGPTEPTQLITYTALNDDFPNPERGIYVDIDLINQTNFSTLYGQGNRVAYAYVSAAPDSGVVRSRKRSQSRASSACAAGSPAACSRLAIAIAFAIINAL